MKPDVPSTRFSFRAACRILTLFVAVLGILPLAGPAAASAQAAIPVPGPEPALNVVVVSDGPTVEPAPKVYLPVVVASGQSAPPPASPYAAALSQALADCAGTTLNQVCYAGGSVTLAGGGPLTTPGQVATLDGVSGLTLVSPDARHWSVALLRLAADSPTPDLGLTLLAFGNVEIRNLTQFDAAAGNGDVAPALSFSSSPVPGEDPVTGGLLVYNPSHEEPLSIHLNGAVLTLASSAVVQAQPGEKMTVTMAGGSAIIQTAAGDGALIQAHQLTVPLDSNGTATGKPSTPTVNDDDLLVPLTPSDEDDLLVDLVPRAQDMSVLLKAHFERAHDRCMQGNSRQVYNVLYWVRFLKEFNFISKNEWPLIDAQVSQCARFEVEFNSVITGSSSVSSGSMHIQGQGMIVSFDIDGRLNNPESMPLTHLSYDFSAPQECPYHYVLTDGALNLSDAAMRINVNRLDISTTIAPVAIDEHLVYTCPKVPPVDLQSLAFWRVMFGALHMSELTDAGYRFAPAHWKYTGNQILAEAIFSDREAPFFDGVSSESMWMVLLHKPGGL